MSASPNIPGTDATLRLRDGRTLGYLEVGKHDGLPVIHCHGQPSSRREVLLLAEQAASLGVRLIGLDRPGIGHSDPKPGFRMVEWPDDVVEVADQLGIERFAIAGFSGGAPFALACAYRIPHRLTACGLISSVAPVALITRSGSRAMRTAFWVESTCLPHSFGRCCGGPCAEGQRPVQPRPRSRSSAMECGLERETRAC